MKPSVNRLLAAVVARARTRVAELEERVAKLRAGLEG